MVNQINYNLSEMNKGDTLVVYSDGNNKKIGYIKGKIGLGLKATLFFEGLFGDGHVKYNDGFRKEFTGERLSSLLHKAITHYQKELEVYEKNFSEDVEIDANRGRINASIEKINKLSAAIEKSSNLGNRSKKGLQQHSFNVHTQQMAKHSEKLTLHYFEHAKESMRLALSPRFSTKTQNTLIKKVESILSNHLYNSDEGVKLLDQQEEAALRSFLTPFRGKQLDQRVNNILANCWRKGTLDTFRRQDITSKDYNKKLLIAINNNENDLLNTSLISEKVMSDVKQAIEDKTLSPLMAAVKLKKIKEELNEIQYSDENIEKLIEFIDSFMNYTVDQTIKKSKSRDLSQGRDFVKILQDQKNKLAELNAKLEKLGSYPEKWTELTSKAKRDLKKSKNNIVQQSFISNDTFIVNLVKNNDKHKELKIKLENELIRLKNKKNSKESQAITSIILLIQDIEKMAEEHKQFKKIPNQIETLNTLIVGNKALQTLLTQLDNNFKSTTITMKNIKLRHLLRLIPENDKKSIEENVGQSIQDNWGRIESGEYHPDRNHDLLDHYENLAAGEGDENEDAPLLGGQGRRGVLINAARNLGAVAAGAVTYLPRIVSGAAFHVGGVARSALRV